MFYQYYSIIQHDVKHDVIVPMYHHLTSVKNIIIIMIIVEILTINILDNMTMPFGDV